MIVIKEKTASFMLSPYNQVQLCREFNDCAMSLVQGDDSANPTRSQRTLEVTIDGVQEQWFIIKFSSDGELLLGKITDYTYLHKDTDDYVGVSYRWESFVRIKDFYDDRTSTIKVKPAETMRLSRAEREISESILEGYYYEMTGG